MSFFAKLTGLKAQQAAADQSITLPPSTERQPEANRAPLLRPEQAPRTGAVPEDFANYRFVESHIVTLKRNNAVTGDIDRRRAVAAHMVSTQTGEDGTFAQMTGTFTARDLVEGKHPDANKIITLLNMQTDSCIVSEAVNNTTVAATKSEPTQKQTQQGRPNYNSITTPV